MQKLKSFGCSFTFGTDLKDCNETPSQNTWPSLLSKHLGLTYECHAKGGSGNLQIFESLLKQVNDHKECIFVINWTWIDRFDYFPLTTDLPAWNTILPNQQTTLADYYYKNLHSEYQDKLLTLTYINATIEILKKTKHRFIMTALDKLVFDREWNSSLATRFLQKSIKNHITTFDGLTFLEWSKKNNYSISSAWHPLETAHQAAFEYIKNLNLV